MTRALIVLFALFLPACHLWEIQDRFMSRAESRRESQYPRHSAFWTKFIEERERAAQSPPLMLPPLPGRKATVLAVFDVDGSKSDFEPETLDALTEYFAMRLASAEAFNLIPRGEVRRLIEAQKAESYRACYDDACRIELGKELAAEKSLSPKILRTGDHCVIGGVLYDLRTEIAEHAASARTACDEEALLDAVDRVVAQLLAMVSA